MAKRKKRRAIGALAMVKQKYNSLPTPVQYGLIGLGALLAYKIIFKSAQEQSNAQIVKGAGDELKDALKTQKLTYAASQYPGFANQIYEGTKYGIGDNYKLVANTMMLMKNNADVAKLIQSYGSRQNYIFGIPQGEPRDLFTNIKAELGSNYGFLSGYVKEINADWAKKGIKYRI